jgi:zinc transport system substrate-binding protein
MITDAISSLDPENADDHRASSAEYVRKLDALDTEYAEVLSAMPTPMVFADRFPFVYLTHDYKIPYLAAFSGCSTEVNSSFGMQIDLISAVREWELPYVITIEGNDKSLAEAIASETGCEIISLNSLQSVKRSDIVSNLSYLEAMTKNLEVLKEASQCH